MANEQINVPSLVVVLVLSGLIIRYLFFSPTTTTTPTHARDAVSAHRLREATVERIQQMFPEVDRRTILWDLQRNSGNIAATTERILSGRMETPPRTFRPPPPPGSTTAAAGASNGQTTAARQASMALEKPAQPDLITRYNLKDKVASSTGTEGDVADTGDGSSQGKARGWSSNREERQSLLQRRRDQMILEARRKMEAKLAADKAKTGTPCS